jgi:hypothetical protein
MLKKELLCYDGENDRTVKQISKQMPEVKLEKSLPKSRFELYTAINVTADYTERNFIIHIKETQFTSSRFPG